MEIVFPPDDRSSDSVDCLECAQPGQIDTWQGERPDQFQAKSLLPCEQHGLFGQ